MPFDVDEANPADDSIVSQFPANERASRTNIVSWIDVDHTEVDGKHRKVTLPEVTDPTAVANTGFVYAKDDGGDTELYYRDDSGDIVQLTKDGALNEIIGTLDAPTGTIMAFFNSTAPAGWVKDTDENDRLLRIVSGAPSKAGSWTISGLSVPSTGAHFHNLPADSSLAFDSGGFRLTANTTETDGAHTHSVSSDGTWRPLYLDVIKATKS